MNKVLHMTVGLPQSGKTTWALSTGYPIVSPDAVRLALHGRPFIAKAEEFVWLLVRTQVRALFLAGHDNVVLDATNISKARRAEWESTEWIRKYHLVECSKAECLNRASATCRSAEHLEGLTRAIERMAVSYEPVTEEEYDSDWSS